MLSEYDFSKPPAVQSDIENDYVEVRPDALPDTTDVIRLHYRQSNSFISLADSYLEVAFTVGAAQSATNTLVNHVGSLFRRISMKINGVTIEQVENLNHVLLVKSMISFSDDYAQSTGSNLFYYHDTGVDFTDGAGDVLLGGHKENKVIINPADVSADATLIDARENPAYNSGYVKRLARSKGGQVSCRVPLHELLSFATVDKVLYNQEIEIELVKAPATESLFGTHAAATVVVNTCNLWINKRILDREGELTFLAKIAAGLDYDFEFLAHQAYLTGTLSGTQTVRITTQSQKLVSAFVMLVPSAYAQTASKSRSVDELGSAEMLLNNERYPIREYTSLGSEVGKSRTYQELVQMLTGGDKQSGISLTFDEYQRSTIIPFNFNSQKNFTGSPSVVELKVNVTGASNPRAIVVLMSEKTVRVSYAGDDTVVTVL